MSTRAMKLVSLPRAQICRRHGTVRLACAIPPLCRAQSSMVEIQNHVDLPFPPIMPSIKEARDIKPLPNKIKTTTMPPNYVATVADLSTFSLPAVVYGHEKDVALGKAMIAAWRKDGILQIAMDEYSRSLAAEAFAASKKYFSLSPEEKQRCVDDQSFAGYIASGEEITDGKADYSEIFTVVKDLPQSDKRVQAKWPCHGPCPWPRSLPEFQELTQRYMDNLGSAGERLLQLISLGLGLPSKDALTKYTRDGWHHMRVLRFPALGTENGRGEAGRGIGSHTDYGLLVIAAQDHVGGLFIRPPYQDEAFANWEKSSAGLNEKDDRWTYVEPQEGVFTCFPGDMMQYITNSYLPSTPHKVGLNTSERFAYAYFHEPNFCSTMKPLDKPQEKGVHYGTHFTNMFMRNYPDRITAKRMINEKRMDKLNSPELGRIE